MSAEANFDRTLKTVAAVVLVLSVAAFFYITYSGIPCFFDDAYMFVRYADHILAGYGHAWNPGGEQTFGSTSLLYVGLVTLVKLCLPWISDPKLLLVSAAIPALGLVAVLTVASARLARHPLLKNNYVVWGALLLPPMILQETFKYHLRSGMDTMLSALGNAVLIWLTLRLVARPKAGRLAAVVAAAYMTYLARPDNGIYATLFPFLSILLLGSGSGREKVSSFPSRLKLLVTFTVSMVALLAVDLLVKRWIFGTALPLPFYAKQQGAYANYMGTGYWNAVGLMRTFFWTAMPFICVILLFMQRRDWRMLAAFFVPVGLTFGYYFTVNQIMGWEARFYYPSLPFFVVAAAMIVDRWALARDSRGPIAASELILRLIVVCLVVLGVRQVTYTTYPWYDKLVAATPAGPSRYTYRTAADKPLGGPATENVFKDIGWIAKNAPPKTKIALSEYGEVGAMAPDTVLIDVVGLHDREFALSGFTAKRLFARKPDLIWMPHYHYTRMIRDILDSDEFWDHYLYYPRAFVYGLAIRKDSPRFEEIYALVEQCWKANYGDRKMEDYLAHRVD